MSTSAAGTVHVLHRFNWVRCAPTSFRRVPGSVRVASYADLQTALHERERLENETRLLVNPFHLDGNLAGLTSFPVAILHDWIVDAGLEPPTPETEEPHLWAKWWKKLHKKMTAEQRGKVWQALDKVRFYDLMERPALPIVYAVVSVTWNYNDEWHYALEEGGKLDAVFRSRTKAEAHCAKANEKARASWGEYSAADGMFSISKRLEFQNPFAPPSGEEDFVSTQDAPFYEVIELEWEQ